MSTGNRRRLIQEIEKTYAMPLVAYVVGDRPSMPAQIGMDAVVRFRRHLEAIGTVESLGFFIYSRGGDTNVPWRLINLLREYCTRLVAFVPFRAHSAATLCCLGADRIVMGRMGELTSIDPSVANQFNPPDPLNPLARVPISVEDVIAFSKLKVAFGIEHDEIANAQVFSALAPKVDPIALGNVYRSYLQIRQLAEQLLRLHIDSAQGCGDGERIEGIVKMLTEKLYSHQHLINRREAGKLGLPVEMATSAQDTLLWNLFSEYSDYLKLETPFNAGGLMPGQAGRVSIDVPQAIIETKVMADVFSTKGIVTPPQPLPPGVQLPPGAQIQAALQITSQSWEIRDGQDPMADQKGAGAAVR